MLQAFALRGCACLSADAVVHTLYHQSGVRDAVVARFGERLRGFDATHVRAVATQTLREAMNADEFVTHGSRLLGFPIEVIPGEEEARLIVGSLTERTDRARLG